MATAEFFLTLHPEPRKQGAHIEKEKYDLIRNFILESLRKSGTTSANSLGDLIESKLTKTFDGPILWYYTTVKLDMEARREIRRVPNTNPLEIELVK